MAKSGKASAKPQAQPNQPNVARSLAHIQFWTIAGPRYVWIALQFFIWWHVFDLIKEILAAAFRSA